MKEVTTHTLINLYNNVDRSHIGDSNPVQLFDLDDYLSNEFDEDDIPIMYFNPDNWNSGQDIIRRFGMNMWDDCKSHKVVMINNNEITIDIIFEDDQWSIVIDVRTSNHLLKYVVIDTWYKQRGQTESITRNGSYIELKEFLEIINLLRKSDELSKYFNFLT